MGLVTASSPLSDWKLHRAWDVTNQRAAQAGVPLRDQLRLNACATDLINSATLARELMALETARFKQRMELFDALSTTERVWDERQHSGQRWSEVRRLVTAVKALFIFARSFHNAAYAVLLRAAGTPASHASLATGIQNQASHLRRILDQELPGFVSWFLEARQIRNDIKLGVGTGYGSHARGSEHTISINVEGVIPGSPPSVGTVRELRAADVEQLVEQSARFMEFVERVVSAGSLPVLRNTESAVR